jgi:hypothetical protein
MLLSGLWVFDISMTQIFQDCIPAPVRGVKGGVQQSLNALFGLLAFALVIFFPDPREFIFTSRLDMLIVWKNLNAAHNQGHPHHTISRIDRCYHHHHHVTS